MESLRTISAGLSWSPALLVGWGATAAETGDGTGQGPTRPA
jgi:hypothetical protein